MKINIKSTNIQITESLKEWTEKKIGEVEKTLGDFGPEIAQVGQREKIEIWVEIGKVGRHHRKGDVFRAEVQLYLPKKKLRVEAIDQDLRTAINIAKEDLQRAVKRYKGKRITRARKWARRIKEIARIDQWSVKEKLKRLIPRRKK